ncbi:MAG: hypothetical protein HUJ26_00165 [Planctomycetaceae bacterium]|nr:hypothetical protein [Planctomycetaceae bacterium]
MKDQYRASVIFGVFFIVMGYALYTTNFIGLMDPDSELDSRHEVVEADDPPDPASSGAVEYAALTFAKKLHAEHLVSPTSAEYPRDNISSRVTTDIEGHEAWIVSGDVDAMNKLGVPIRNSWKAVIVQSPETGDLSPVCVTLDNTVVFGDRQYLE